MIARNKTQDFVEIKSIVFYFNIINLSLDKYIIIAKHSLINSLKYLRELLRKIEQSYKSNSLSYNNVVNSFNSNSQKIISRLLYILQNYKIAFNFRSKIETKNIVFKLFTLFKRIQNVNINYEHYCALLRLVIRKASNINIWNVVFDFIITIFRIIFFTSISLSFNNIFVTKSFSFFQDSKQTRKIIELAIFYKIKKCIYRNVDNFFKKYFEKQFWSRKSKIIYNAIKKQYKDERWINFFNSSNKNIV